MRGTPGRWGPDMSHVLEGVTHRQILITTGAVHLPGDLATPSPASGAGVFAHGRGRLPARRGAAPGGVRGQRGVRGLPVGYFGASTGAAAALWAAGEPGARVAAIVSRGGRPDLAGPRLGARTAPTLLIVGGGGRGGPRP